MISDTLWWPLRPPGTRAQNIHAQKAPIRMDSKNKIIILNGIILTSIVIEFINFIIFNFKLFLTYLLLFHVHECLSVQQTVPSTCRGQKRASDHLKLEL